jgi:hypothetical protein
MNQLGGTNDIASPHDAYEICLTCRQPLSHAHDRLVARLVQIFIAVVVLVAMIALYLLRGLIFPDLQQPSPAALGASLPTRAIAPPQAQNNAHNLTFANFESLKPGMTYDQVKAILKYEGEVGAVHGIAGMSGKSPGKMMHWQNPNGSNIDVLFRDNRLVFKSQFRLQKPK